jgi:hypothetical protein
MLSGTGLFLYKYTPVVMAAITNISIALLIRDFTFIVRFSLAT